MRTAPCHSVLSLIKTDHTAFVLLLLVAVAFGPCDVGGREPEFSSQQLTTRLGVGYAVRLIDMNDDERLDICIVDSKRVLWLENPNWDEHVLIATPDGNDNVCFAPHDIDGDGLLDFALGADWAPRNTSSGGTIQWIGGDTPTGTWELFPIDEEPTVHRMRFANLFGDSRPELIVAPLLGRGTEPPDFEANPVRILAYSVPDDPRTDAWPQHVISEQLHVTHNLCPTDLNGDGRHELLIVSFEGVWLLEPTASGIWRHTRVGTGDQESRPNRGASEIDHGQLADGRDYLATIEPWHGNQVVVYLRPDGPRPAGDEWLWTRHVLDQDLQWGHAVTCADLDGDDDQELVVGVRDNVRDGGIRGVRVYDPQDSSGRVWSRVLVDPGSVAVEDLAVGDLNADGKADIVAVGRQTHNVKIYWNETSP